LVENGLVASPRQARERIIDSDSCGHESVETESDEDVPTATMAVHVSDTSGVSIDAGILALK